MKFFNKYMKTKLSKIKIIKRNRTELVPINFTGVGVGSIKRVLLYNNVGDRVVRNSSGNLKSSNVVVSNNNIDYSDSQNLEGLTVIELREIAKKDKINLKGKRKKKDIANIIQSFFIAKGRPSDVEIINPCFSIISDGNGRLYISLWFRESRPFIRI